MEAKDIAVELERTVNAMGSSKGLGEIANRMTNMHRTLVQSFTSGFTLPFIKKMSEMYTNGYYDARNEVACKMCNTMWNALVEQYPYMKNGCSLPLI